MRILLACPYSWHAHGGVQAHIAQVAGALRRRGHVVAIVAPGRPGAAADDGVTIVGAPMRIAFNGSVAPSCMELAAITRVRRFLEVFAPDVVHTHEPFSSFVSGAAARYAAVPVVATFHCALDRWRDRAVYFAFTRAHWWVERAVDVRLAVSTSAAATARLATSGTIQIVPNGVETDCFAAAALPIPEDGPILFVGRLEHRKGLATLLDAMTELWRRRPALRLTIVGDGAGRALVERLPADLRPRVDLKGHCSREDLLRHYAAARVFVAPSLGGESFGMALLDALASGRPVVASDIASYRTLLDDGRVGLLATPGDAPALASRLAHLLDNPAEAAALGVAGTARAREFTWGTIAARLETVYEAALAEVSVRDGRPARAGVRADVRPYDAR